MNKLFFTAVFFASALFLVGCNDDDNTPTTETLTLNLSGLENLGADYNYEGWVIVDGSPVSTGLFTVDDSGNLSDNTFDVNIATLEAATTFVLTIEPNPDSDPTPSATKIMGGDFSGDSASVSIAHGAALGTDLTGATGDYILATPTDGTMDDENSGVWWFDTSTAAGTLDIPTLPAGWKYEGWAVIDGTPVSTGTFSSASGSDDAATFSGTAANGPAFPGEDFLMNAPDGLTFPTDLAGGTIVISVEPSPDNSSAPFVLKPLVGQVPADATDRTLYMMSNNASATNPTGTVSR